METIHIAIFVIVIITLVYYLMFETSYIRDHETTHVEYARTIHAGMIRGILLGCILGDNGIYTGIRNGAVFAIINPIMLYIGY